MNAPLVILLLFLSSFCSAEVILISITLPEFQVSKYERPYAAVWIADKQNKPVRVLNLWSANERWLKELKHFWRRVLRNHTNMIDGISGATRGPGHYRLTWDGLDHAGEILNQNEYRLCAEVVREHGGHRAKCLNFRYPLDPGHTFRVTPNGELTQLTIVAAQ